MEILNVFGVHWKLLAAQVVNFSIALYILHRYLYKPVFAMLKKRQDIIAKGLSDAEAAGAAKMTIEAERTSIITDARTEGGKIMEDLRKKAVEQEHDILRKAQESSVATLAEAKLQAEAERAHILRESEKEVARMAVLSAEKILRAHAKSA